MGLVRVFAISVLALSFLTFVALFGRIPAFRKTPIGFLHRVIWIHIPNFLLFLDSRLVGGCLSRCLNSCGRYLLYENHPLVLIFFVTILCVSEVLFIPRAWPKIGSIHHLFVPVAVLLPYLFLYAGVISKSVITPENHWKQLQLYPYDHVLFHPDHLCRTCHLLKPARSKHCKLCKVCVARHDHHCIWLNNCVGRNNYRFFLALLLSVSVLLMYGAYLGYIILDRTLQMAIFPQAPLHAKHWSKGQGWSVYFQFWGLAISDDIRIGAVFLLALLSAPLSLSLLLYHIYLLWAGMTTNESAKWTDWRGDIAGGFAFKAKSSQIYGSPEGNAVEPNIPWPVNCDQTLIFTDDGNPPKIGYKLTKESTSIIQPDNTDATIDPRWIRVSSINEVVNIYDLGFWGNLRDGLCIS